MTNLFASADESKLNILSTLQDYLLEDAWTRRVSHHLCEAATDYTPEAEEKQHSLYHSFQLYEKLVEERLISFNEDYPEFGATPEDLIAQLSLHSANPLLGRLIDWTLFDGYLAKVEELKKSVDLGTEAADLMGLL